MGQTIELPRTQGPGSGLGGAWRVIVRNDDHNTFDHVARTLARYIPGVTVDQRLRDRRPHPQHRPGDRLERPSRAGRAVLGAAPRRGADDGPARAGLAPSPVPRLVLGPLLRHVGRDDATVWVKTDAAAVRRVEPSSGALRAQRDLRGRGPSLRARPRHRAASRGGTRPTRCSSTASASGRRRRGLGLAGELHPPALRRPTRCAICFGSCRGRVPDTTRRRRCPRTRTTRGREHDALSALASDAFRRRRTQWPHLLLLLGDQVYADEVPPRHRGVDRRAPRHERAARRGGRRLPGVLPPLRGLVERAGVRWLLSTVPTAMIFDDHDVHDDWNTSDAWVRDMRGQGWWDERIVGGFMAYWVFQHLGNLARPTATKTRLCRAVLAAARATRGRSCATSPSGPTARSPARAGATGATSGARAWWSWTRAPAGCSRPASAGWSTTRSGRTSRPGRAGRLRPPAARHVAPGRAVAAGCTLEKAERGRLRRQPGPAPGPRRRARPPGAGPGALGGLRRLAGRPGGPAGARLGRHATAAGRAPSCCSRATSTTPTCCARGSATLTARAEATRRCIRRSAHRSATPLDTRERRACAWRSRRPARPPARRSRGSPAPRPTACAGNASARARGSTTRSGRSSSRAARPWWPWTAPRAARGAAAPGAHRRGRADLSLTTRRVTPAGSGEARLRRCTRRWQRRRTFPAVRGAPIGSTSSCARFHERR